MPKKIIAYYLLFNLVFLFSPRLFWHSHTDFHDFDQEQSDNHEKNTEHSHADCFLCVITLQPAVENNSLILSLGSLENHSDSEFYDFYFTKEFFHFFSLRAPPLTKII